MQKFQIFLKSFSFLHNFSKFHHYSNQKQIMYVILYKTYSSENVLQWFNPFWPFTWGCLCFNPQLTCPNLTGTPKTTLDIKHKISKKSELKRSKVTIMARDAGTQKNKSRRGELSYRALKKTMRKKACPPEPGSFWFPWIKTEQLVGNWL